MYSISEPTNCPSCNGPLSKVNDQLFCTSSTCPAQVNGKILHFCKVLGIKGLGPKTVEKLDILSVAELFYLDKYELIDAIGSELVADKLLLEIEKAKSADVATVIESFSIPLIGNTAAKKLAKVISTPDDITEDLCKEAGLGEKATSNIINWINTEYNELKAYLPFTYTNTINIPSNGKTVCITGKLKSYKKKSDAESDLLSAGYILVDSITKTTNYLVDEEDGKSAKRLKAEKYGIPIITDLNDLLLRKT